MLSLLLLVLAFAPVAVIGLFIYRKDKYDREPIGALASAFLLGHLSIIPAIFLSIGLGKIFPESESMTGMGLHAFISVALAEELTKFLFIMIWIYRKPYFNEPFDGIIYSVMVGLGFAFLENLLYIFEEGDVGVAVLRMFTAVPGHAVYAVAMGYFIGLAKFDGNKKGILLFSGLLLATLMHGSYDFFIFQQNYPALAILTLVGLVLSMRWAFRAIARQQVESRDHMAEQEADFAREQVPELPEDNNPAEA